jgi:hypothetical protein
MTRRSAFRLYVACGSLAAAIGLAYALVIEGLPPITGLLLFVALIIYSQHRAVEFAEGAAVNADFMVLMAAVVAFHSAYAYSGPLIVAVCRGIYLPQIRRREFSLILFNSFSGAAGVAAAAFALSWFNLGPSLHLPHDLIAAAVTAVCCVVALWLALVPGQVLRGQRLKPIITSFTPMALESLPFSMLGFFIGWLYLGIGAGAVVMLIVPMFIAREVFASYMRVKESHEETVGMLVRALEAKDRYTSGHSERVAKYARYVGEELNFMPARLERLRFAALMHDIGKLVVPNHLLNKPGRLTEAEFAQVRLHEKVSVQMLSHIDFLRPIAAASHSDNTAFDPDDSDHPIEPYIVMIADAYDAMTSTRAYRKALPQGVAFQELRDKAGVQFHPACVEALISAIEARGEKHGAGYEVQHEFDDAPDAGLGSAGLGDLLPSDSAS